MQRAPYKNLSAVLRELNIALVTIQGMMSSHSAELNIMVIQSACRGFDGGAVESPRTPTEEATATFCFFVSSSLRLPHFSILSLSSVSPWRLRSYQWCVRHLVANGGSLGVLLLPACTCTPPFATDESLLHPQPSSASVLISFANSTLRDPWLVPVRIAPF